MKKFHSTFEKLGEVDLPAFSGTRIMMMPFVIGDMATVPDEIGHWRDTLATLSAMSGYEGEVGYITIDEKEVMPQKTHRRHGVHVDGVYAGAAGGWGGGGWGGGGTRPKVPGKQTPMRRTPAPLLGVEAKPVPLSEHGTGFLTVSSHAGCRAWEQDFVGWPGPEGECEHIADQCRDETAAIFAPREVYWVDPLCVHESMPMQEVTRRQFVRLSLPSEAPWFEGYAVNPLGIMPTGPILPARPDAFMSA